jgi:coiled-coil and C2 domain-containing protein 2A
MQRFYYHRFLFFLLSFFLQSEFFYYAADDMATYVKVLLTLDPVLTTVPTIPDEICLSNVVHEDRAIASYARRWLDAIKSIGPHTADRNYKLFGTSSAGLNVFICRYLTAQQPPKGFDSRRSCIHLISNIPFMNDSQSFIGELDLWCTTQQFWEIGAGDEEEHAVTLFNYLYYLALKGRTVATTAAVGAGASAGAGAGAGAGLLTPSSLQEALLKENVFLVMGKAVPEGETVYVMIRDTKRSSHQGWNPENFLMINPWTGYVYSAIDPNCPLRDVYTLATPNNVWANLQVQARPSEMSFDLANLTNWRPFFGLRFPAPAGGLNTVQTEIEYLDTSPGYAVEIEKSVFQAIRNRIRKWRSKRVRYEVLFYIFT